MGIKTYKPTSPARRQMTGYDFEEITTSKPERSLIERLYQVGGRKNKGRITVRHQGGGHKRRYRLVDFRRDKPEVPGKVVSVEYDPNRTARISLVHFADGEKRYIIHPIGLSVGDTVVTSDKADIKPGNCLKLEFIPLGTFVHNVSRSAVVASSAALRAASPRSWPRKAATSSSACPRVSSARCGARTVRPSVRLATLSTRTS